MISTLLRYFFMRLFQNNLSNPYDHHVNRPFNNLHSRLSGLILKRSGDCRSFCIVQCECRDHILLYLNSTADKAVDTAPYSAIMYVAVDSSGW